MPFLGMRGNNDWETDERPYNWRQMLLRLYPGGRAALTAVQSMGKTESTDDPQFYWYTKSLATQNGAITNIYTDVVLATAYTSGGTAGTTLYVKGAEADIGHCAPGKKVILRDASDLDVDVVAKVTQVVKNGASSYMAVKLLEADDNSSNGDLSDADRFRVMGNINPEGGVTPDAISYLPTKYYNLTNIWRSPLEMTRTAIKTRLRTGDQRREAKRECLELHGVEMEWDAILGVRYEGYGDNGKPERSGYGVIPFLRAYNSTNIRDYTSDTLYSGQAWLEGGDDWMLDSIELLYRYDDGTAGEFVAYCGSGVVKALERLAKAGLEINIQPGANVGYGIKMREWVTSFGSIYLRTHPLFSYETTMLNSMVIIKSTNMVFRALDDTMFYAAPDGKNFAYTTSGRRIDGINEEFLTEGGWEFHHPQNAMWLRGFGSANTA